jgi:hypothetical protein
VIVDAGLWHHEDRTPTHGYEATREGAMSLISLNVRFRGQPGSHLLAVWLDLGPEPVVFSHPDMGNRYYLFPMYSLWMPVVASPGRRTPGGEAASYLISGPGWKGKVPAGMTQIKSPTRYLVIIGRTYADGTDQDFAIVNALQDKYQVVPLSAYGKPYTYVAPPVDPNPGFSMTDKPQQVIDAMDPSTYFNMMTRLNWHDSDVPQCPLSRPSQASSVRVPPTPGLR